MTSKRLKKLQTEKLAFSGIPEGRPSSIIDLPDDRSSWYTKNGKLRSKVYHRELAKLHYELVKLQGWIVDQGLKVAIIFEGRDAAGKGGSIKRITAPLNPSGTSSVMGRTCRRRARW